MKDGHAELLTDQLFFYYFRIGDLQAYQNYPINAIESTLLTFIKMGCQLSYMWSEERHNSDLLKLDVKI